MTTDAYTVTWPVPHDDVYLYVSDVVNDLPAARIYAAEMSRTYASATIADHVSHVATYVDGTLSATPHADAVRAAKLTGEQAETTP